MSPAKSLPTFVPPPAQDRDLSAGLLMEGWPVRPGDIRRACGSMLAATLVQSAQPRTSGKRRGEGRSILQESSR